MVSREIWIKQALVSNSIRPSDSCYFDALWKTHSCSFIQIAFETYTEQLMISSVENQ